MLLLAVRSKLGIPLSWRTASDCPWGSGCGCFFLLNLQLPAQETLGVAITAPPPVTAHLLFLTPKHPLLCGQHIKKQPFRGKVSLPGPWLEETPPPQRAGLLQGPSSMSSHFISRNVNKAAGNSWRRQKQFDSFIKKPQTSVLFSARALHSLFALITRVTFWGLWNFSSLCLPFHTSTTFWNKWNP